jgi:hypothetical protein
MPWTIMHPWSIATSHVPLKYDDETKHGGKVLTTNAKSKNNFPRWGQSNKYLQNDTG